MDETSMQAGNLQVQVVNSMPEMRKNRGRASITINIKTLIATFALILIATAAGVGGYSYFNYMDQWVSTNNAHVDGHVYTVASAVAGTVSIVEVAENTHVTKGDLLLSLDARMQKLAVEKTKAAIETNQVSIKALRNVPGRVAELGMAQAKHEELMLMLEEAQVLYGKTKITAPADGYLANVMVKPGEFVNTGQPLKYVISHDSLWITANFTETQIRNVIIGNEADIYVDAFPNESFRGKVVNIAPAGGGVFALFPPDATAGNWVRTPQKIPVEIAFTGTIGQDTKLRIGMLARVRVKR